MKKEHDVVNISADRKAELLYKKNRMFRELFNLMFDDFGWAADFIHADALKIYKLVKKYRKHI